MKTGIDQTIAFWRFMARITDNKDLEDAVDEFQIEISKLQKDNRKLVREINKIYDNLNGRGAVNCL